MSTETPKEIDTRLADFYSASAHLLGWLHAIASLPAEPIPAPKKTVVGFRKLPAKARKEMDRERLAIEADAKSGGKLNVQRLAAWQSKYSALAKPILATMSRADDPNYVAKWNIEHPDVRGKITTGEFMRDLLQHWHDRADAAYRAAKSDDLRADVVNMASIFGPRDYLLQDIPGGTDEMRNSHTLRHVSAYARDPRGLGLREFESCLAALRRSVALEAVRKNLGATTRPEIAGAMPSLRDEQTDKQVIDIFNKSPGTRLVFSDAMQVLRSSSDTGMFSEERLRRSIQRLMSAGKLQHHGERGGYSLTEKAKSKTAS